MFVITGQFGVIVYSVGFIAAALSSMLTVPLGAAITADSVFSDRQAVAGGSDNKTYEEDDNKRNNPLAVDKMAKPF